ncbi:MAG: hypothetical protein Q8J96_16380 [Rhodocyclaceae bacterium]|nr:hypothetical protein [Rhodocyclaceae bacterium]
MLDINLFAKAVFQALHLALHQKRGGNNTLLAILQGLRQGYDRRNLPGMGVGPCARNINALLRPEL